MCGLISWPDISLDRLDLQNRSLLCTDMENTLDFAEFLLSCGMALSGDQDQTVDWLEKFFFPFNWQFALGGLFGVVTKSLCRISELANPERVTLIAKKGSVVNSQL